MKKTKGISLSAFSHPLGLLLATACGALLGWLAPGWSAPVALFGRMFLAVMEMAGTPLLMVATAFGLRQVIALPYPGRRLLLLLTLSTATLLASGLVGALAGMLMGVGSHLPESARTELGRWVQDDATTNPMTMTLWTRSANEAAASGWVSSVPDNVFAAMVSGDARWLTLCALIFGLAFALQPRERSQALAAHLETIYRAFELLIAQVNRLLPLLAFGMAAHLVANFDRGRLHVVGGLLLALLLSVLFLAVVAVAVLVRQTKTSLPQVLSALRAPLMIGLFTKTPVATIPSLIEALSARLGLSRGIVELLVPAGAVFMRAGAAVHLGLLAVFATQLYERPISMYDLPLIAAAAALASLTTAGTGVLLTVAASAIAMHWVGLPSEAVVVVAIVIDAPCHALRSVVQVLAVAAITSVVCRGLPSERAAVAEQVAQSPLRLVFSWGGAALAAACLATAGLLALVTGIGVGLRQGGASVTGGPADAGSSAASRLEVDR
ncbi:MAG: sodium:dicarboxylate symporter [Betaproteobacteria bacterium]|nr:sodium:dicarboxylate symporter [Betaproteobacteria bacterium]